MYVGEVYPSCMLSVKPEGILWTLLRFSYLITRALNKMFPISKGIGEMQSPTVSSY